MKYISLSPGTNINSGASKWHQSVGIHLVVGQIKALKYVWHNKQAAAVSGVRWYFLALGSTLLKSVRAERAEMEFINYKREESTYIYVYSVYSSICS